MRKIFTLIAISLFLTFSSIGSVRADDGLAFEWGKTLGGSGIDTGVAFTSPSGEVYLAGYFSSTVDFDPSSTVENHTSNGGYDMFMSKYDSNGNYSWTKTWGGNSGSVNDSIRQMKWDSSNNLYILGDYGSTSTDLNPDSGTDSFTSAGSIDSFLTKYDANGNYIWTKTWGGASVDRASMMTFDISGNIYIVGEFQGTPDFDPSPSATFNQASNGNYDGYLLKLDSSSNFQWVKSWGGSAGMDKAFSIHFDSSGNYYIAGGFSYTADFDTSGATDNLSVVGGNFYDMFLTKYSASDSYVWTKTWGTIGDDWCPSAECLLLDSNNNIYITGYAGGNISGTTTIDLDSGASTDNRTLNGAGDVLLIKLDQNGDYVWGKSYGGTLLDLGWGLNLDSHNLLYVSGWYNGTADFDPTTSTDSFTSAGGTDIFINKFDLNGNYLFTKSIGGTGADRPQKISLHEDDMYFGGFASTALDMNPDGGVSNSTSYGSVDALFIKFVIDATGPASFSLISPSSYTLDSRPTLSFKKAIDATSDILSYSVALDPGKNNNWNIAGIPASNDTSKASSLWRDNDEVKVEFANENDTTTANDEIRVYFKNLDSRELTEGRHTWRLTAYDSEGNSTEETKEFFLDRNNPNASNLAIANISSISDGAEYVIGVDQRMISYSGLASDSYFGSTYESDTFDEVSSGPRTATLVIKKMKNSARDLNMDLKSDAAYDDFLSQEVDLSNVSDYPSDKKEASFYIKISHPLPDDYYRVEVVVKDLLGNSYTSPAHYLLVNYTKPESTTSGGKDIDDGSNDDKAKEEKIKPSTSAFPDKTAKVLQINPQNKNLIIRSIIIIGIVLILLIAIYLIYIKRRKKS